MTFTPTTRATLLLIAIAPLALLLAAAAEAAWVLAPLLGFTVLVQYALRQLYKQYCR